jgi:hypothetical protein
MATAEAGALSLAALALILVQQLVAVPVALHTGHEHLHSAAQAHQFVAG